MEKYYVAGSHNITLALKEINYPITKAELIKKVGEKEVQVDFDEKILLKDLFKDLPLDEFSTAAELYNNITCVTW